MTARYILFVALICSLAKIAQGGTILSDTHIDVCEGGHSPEERRAFADILARIGDKWTVLVVGVLAHGPRRYSQIFKLVEGVSQRMLTLTLKSLERDGLVTRTVYPTNPPRVDYELTERGKTLTAPLHLLWTWAQANRTAIEGARRDFEQQSSKNGAAA
jgi:DNA-binding HxlR family transcriptional regulator